MEKKKPKKKVGKGKKKNKINWPKRDKLRNATDVIWRFQSMCRHQLELGYWVTMDFPTKHHINKILSLQYMDREVIEQVYGKALVKEAFSLIPACKHYIAFTKEYDTHEELEQEE